MAAAVHWSAEMVEDFIVLLKQGEDLRACAVELSRRHGVKVSRQVAVRKLCKLRLGPRKADVPAVNALRPGLWTAVQNGELLHLVDECGLSVEEAAARIGRPVVATSRKLKQLRSGDGGYVQMPNPKAAMRHCLRCRTPFVSEGRHNRMCDPCRRAPAAAVDVVAHAGVSL